MVSFLRRILIFSIPILIYCVIIIVVDPYNYFFNKNFIPDKVKIYVINRSAKSMPRGNTLWKFNDFIRHAKTNIIIGDSRAFDLDVKKIKEISGEDYYNFGVPGGNFNSIIETFWFAAHTKELRKVYIQVSFHTYSAQNNYNLMSDAKKVYNQPYLFFTRHYFFTESVLDLYYSLFQKKLEEDTDVIDSFSWHKILMTQGDAALAKMKYPEVYYNELKKISQYCKDQNIEIAFIIFPDQKDFHDIILKRSLEKDYLRYKKDINSLGKVYDFDVPSSKLYDDRKNYRDIFHLDLNLINTYIVRNIWEKEPNEIGLSDVQDFTKKVSIDTDN